MCQKLEVQVAMNKPKSDSISKTEGWKTINWRKAERYVFKLQKRIYAASRCGDVKRLRQLQKTLMRSWSNRVLAVRRVTVENQGKKTAGVDGVKSLSPAARLKLVGQLKLTGKSKPTRRVWIPKPGSQEKRPLSIPTMESRALQAVVKAALEPEWEARFEATHTVLCGSLAQPRGFQPLNAPHLKEGYALKVRSKGKGESPKPR